MVWHLYGNISTEFVRFQWLGRLALRRVIEKCPAEIRSQKPWDYGRSVWKMNFTKWRWLIMLICLPKALLKKEHFPTRKRLAILQEFIHPSKLNRDSIKTEYPRHSEITQKPMTFSFLPRPNSNATNGIWISDLKKETSIPHRKQQKWYPLVHMQKTMENHHL